MLKAAVLGATGNVGQIFIQMLSGHPWFEVSFVAASKKNVGRKYIEASNWRQPFPIPKEVCNLDILPLDPKFVKDADIIFEDVEELHKGLLNSNSFYCEICFKWFKP